MIMSSLLLHSHQFLAERDWLQYHNPKNDAFNIYVEVGELAEHFIELEHFNSEIANEMADVFFAVLGFASVDTCNLSKAIGALINNSALDDEHISYEQLREIIIQHKNELRFAKNASAQQLVLALAAESAKLADMFLWCSVEESKIRLAHQKKRVDGYIARIFVHLVLLANFLGLNLIDAYTYKMEENAKKYPPCALALDHYTALKDKRYEQKESERLRSDKK